jgi:CxxC-x17-CxxC domain-containing protein
MQFADRDLNCSSCGLEFVFSAGEQQFFHGKGYTNDPKHCKACKAKRSGVGRVRPVSNVQCTTCGIQTTVPFKPTQGRPVLCRTCFDIAPKATTVCDVM